MCKWVTVSLPILTALSFVFVFIIRNVFIVYFVFNVVYHAVLIKMIKLQKERNSKTTIILVDYRPIMIVLFIINNGNNSMGSKTKIKTILHREASSSFCLQKLHLPVSPNAALQ